MLRNVFRALISLATGAAAGIALCLALVWLVRAATEDPYQLRVQLAMLGALFVSLVVGVAVAVRVYRGAGGPGFGGKGKLKTKIPGEMLRNVFRALISLAIGAAAGITLCLALVWLVRAAAVGFYPHASADPYELERRSGNVMLAILGVVFVSLVAGAAVAERIYRRLLNR